MPTVSIPLTQGKCALIDEEDLPLVAPYKWHAVANGARWYAVTFFPGERKPTRMHRLVMGFPASAIDHRNGDGLDNRRENIRVATPGQNAANMATVGPSGYKGVYWDRSKQRWTACMITNGERVFYRRFHDAEDAARAYDEAVRRHRGEFAVLNFPEEGERGVDGVVR